MPHPTAIELTPEHTAIILIRDALGVDGGLEAERIVGEIQARAADHGARLALGATPNPHANLTIYDRATGLSR